MASLLNFMKILPDDSKAISGGHADRQIDDTNFTFIFEGN
jgi:hypothetical protein